MTNPVHLLTVAALLLVAFLVGATTGSLIRLLVLRLSRQPAAIAVTAVETAPTLSRLAAPPAAVPLSAPTVGEPQPAVVPATDFTATMLALANETPSSEVAQSGDAPVEAATSASPFPASAAVAGMQPARAAGATTFGREVPAPLHENPLEFVEPVQADETRTAEVIAFPNADPEPLPELSADADAETDPAAERIEPLIVEAAPVVPPESVVSPDDDSVDEDAAMRAIEGNWTPRRPPPRQPRPVDPAETPNEAVAASARAVASARRTAEAVVADATANAGRPNGLAAPRDGRKDDLSHIIGVLPVIETALNTLGIYHFDQLAALSSENVSWIEGHLGIPGRISRELWREQARELSAVLSKPERAAE